MGTDIYLHFEKREDGSWKKIEVQDCLLPDERNYILFGFLAGVRKLYEDEYTSQFVGRGIPKDSCCGNYDIDWTFAHTYAYLSELLEAPWENVNLEKCYFRIFCEYIWPRLAGHESIPCETRVIMAFSS